MSYKFQSGQGDFKLDRLQKEIQDNFVSVDKDGNIHLKGNVFCDSVFLNKNSLHVGSKKLETPEGTDSDKRLIYNHTKKILEWTNKAVFVPVVTLTENTTEEDYDVTVEIPVSDYYLIKWWVSTSAYGSPANVSPTGATVSVTTGTNMGSESATAVNHAVTDSTGKLVINISTSAGSATDDMYVHVVVQDVVYSENFSIKADV